MKLLCFSLCLLILGAFFPTIISARKAKVDEENMDDDNDNINNNNNNENNNGKDLNNNNNNNNKAFVDHQNKGESLSNIMDSSSETRSRKKKLFPVFQIVTFPNSICVGSNNRNGTCYTAAECTSKGGTTSGNSCASGYGVCCIFTLSCGGTTSQNCSYLVQASTTKAPTTDPCTYTICRCNSNICRIRLDFTTFNIAGPVTGSTTATTVTAGTSTGGAIGDCVTDSFSLTSPGKTGSPVICGFNTGQHMIVDASDECSIANFDIGSSGDTREWNIKVTQYACGDSQGGPPGCLQYFTGTTGTVSSYNFPTASSTVGATTTHLSSQCYTICFRQAAGRCSICYTTAISNPTSSPTIQSSFGLSNSPAGFTIATSSSGDSCTSDYLVIPNALDKVASAMVGTNRICGRIFDASVGGTIATVPAISVCSLAKPFQIMFKTDANEVTTAIAMIPPLTPTTNAQINELSDAPGGIIGFSLNYVEQPC